MRRLLSVVFLILFLCTSFVLAKAEDESMKRVHPEVARTRAFPAWLAEKKLLERANEKDFHLHLEKVEIEQREYQANLQEYRRQKKMDKPLESTPAYRVQNEKRDEIRRDRKEAELEFKAEKAEERKLLKQAQIDTLAELGLPENRPRYGLDKRALYGATQKFTRPSSGSSSGFGGGGSSYTPPENNNFPPPPAGFDDFPPPPSFPGEDNFDLPPPPPLSPDGDVGMPSDDFFPPPPPPPPPVGDDFQF